MAWTCSSSTQKSGCVVADKGLEKREFTDGPEDSWVFEGKIYFSSGAVLNVKLGEYYTMTVYRDDGSWIETLTNPDLIKEPIHAE